MSYILDALKKSDQERQQGTAPNLHSTHGSIPSDIDFSSFKRHRTFWLIPGGVFIFLVGLGIFFFQHQGQLDQGDLTKSTETALLANELQAPPPQVLVKEKVQVFEPQIAAEETVSDLPTVVQKEAPQTFVPFLNALPAALRAKIPTLKFAGHTYSENPYQRMIIINGKILREGDMIDSNTRLAEINWEGVTIDFKGTRFQVKTD
jgi:general secretion pathway protein B